MIATAEADVLMEAIDSASSPALTLAVAIATSGRATVLAETLADLQNQTSGPEQVFIVYSRQEDVSNLPERFPTFRFLQATGGLCEKRNLLLRLAVDVDLIFFMDDDFHLDPAYLKITKEAFIANEELVGATGTVLADGAKGPGMTFAEAQDIFRAAASETTVRAAQHEVFNTYGCNMTFRLSAIRAHRLGFDEGLPAYAWYEDIDFSRRLSRFGQIMRLGHALGVHLGVKTGRVSGLRLGYSQIANPIYMARKGSFPWSHTLKSAGRHLLINLVRSFRPESYVDRRGRLRGNLLALFDLLRGRMRPQRILNLG